MTKLLISLFEAFLITYFIHGLLIKNLDRKAQVIVDTIIFASVTIIFLAFIMPKFIYFPW